ncbi:MAG: hypothetical protein GXO90_03195 [FCB group bacterium]|nr:hypothetical protein [FCB group bacterium]
MVIKLARFGILLVLMVAFSEGQSKETAQPAKPCQSPVLLKVARNGLRSLKLREVPVYVYRGWQCRRSGVSREAFRKVDQRQLETDYTKAHRFLSWTSTWAYCVTSVVFLFYLEKLT